MKRIILISGSRKITDPALVFDILHKYIKKNSDILIFGDATGVDLLVHAYAHAFNINHHTPYKPNWALMNAALLRNSQMVSKCYYGICFGNTPGTMDTKRKLEKEGKLLYWWNN